MKTQSWHHNGLTVAALTALALAWGCSRSQDLPGDTDPKQPWAASSARPPAPTPAAVGIVDDKLFDVESVMRNQGALNITPEQKAVMLRELDAAQTEFNHLEWELNGEKEKLAAALSGEQVDEKAALEAGERVTNLEGKLKLAHLRLLVRVKNQLTPEQQGKLRSLTK